MCIVPGNDNYARLVLRSEELQPQKRVPSFLKNIAILRVPTSFEINELNSTGIRCLQVSSQPDWIAA